MHKDINNQLSKLQIREILEEDAVITLKVVLEMADESDN